MKITYQYDEGHPIISFECDSDSTLDQLMQCIRLLLIAAQFDEQAVSQFIAQDDDVTWESK